MTRNVKITLTATQTGATYLMRAYPTEINDKSYEMPVYILTVEGTDIKGIKKTKNYNCLRFSIYYNDPKNPDTHYKTLGGPFISGLANEQTHICPEYKKNYTIHNRAGQEVGALVIAGSFYIHEGPSKLTDIRFASAGCVEIIGSFKEFKEYIALLAGGTGNTTDILLQLVSDQKLAIYAEKATKPKLKPVPYP